MYQTETDQVLITVLLIYLGVIFFALIIGLASYLFKSIGMYTMGKRKGIQNAWLAFIPYGRTYFLGELSGPIHLKRKTITNPGIWLILVPIISSVISSIFMGLFYASFFAKMIGMTSALSNHASEEAVLRSLFGGPGGFFMIMALILFVLASIFLTAVQNVLIVLINKQIYAQYTEDNMAIVHTILGLFIPLYTSIYFFVIRNNEPIFIQKGGEGY
ncbi:magnesium-transporting ATPase (P-type) [Aequitasia blattaphilus]|uniref:Uncharacterized protein n=1 Tax=Aequitasia blattaphilus TaxID=2949332 RepID=A0ABT1E9T5_9FIRM|nr:hypothetical protein [Aequitasia blattaphilus]MCP1102369.1 hypothetical protein [Aequitasia blattaphilus]MCR8615009.1 hypothetical protein [Aequitasia blattaphilus]